MWSWLCSKLNVVDEVHVYVSMIIIYNQTGTPTAQLKMGFDLIWEGFIDCVLCGDWRTDGFGGLSKSVISVLFYRCLKTIAIYVKEKIWRFTQKDSQHERDNERDQSLALSPCLSRLRTDHPCIPTSAWPVNECATCARPARAHLSVHVSNKFNLPRDCAFICCDWVRATSATGS